MEETGDNFFINPHPASRLQKFTSNVVHMPEISFNQCKEGLLESDMSSLFHTGLQTVRGSPVPSINSMFKMVVNKVQ